MRGLHHNGPFKVVRCSLTMPRQKASDWDHTIIQPHRVNFAVTFDQFVGHVEQICIAS